MNTLKSVARSSEVEINVKKSRFIASVFPASSEREAEEFLGRVRNRFAGATHNVFAWQVGLVKMSQRCSDDGEPGGTAGRPVLEVIKQNELTNVLVVVTRYFGGIKLGTGGLTRAYSLAAQKGIDSAGVVAKCIHGVYEIVVDYSLSGKIKWELEAWGKVKETAYAEQVKFVVWIPGQRTESLLARLREITGGQVTVKKTGRVFAEM